MKGYYFTASTTNAQVQLTRLGHTQTAERIRTWSACSSMVVCAENAGEAQKRFEQWLQSPAPEGENPIQTQINKIVGAEVVGQLLTETGNVPLDWPAVSKQAYDILQATAEDDFEQGYWVDVNEVVPARPISSSADNLRQKLPEDIKSGLNWSTDKTFYFLLTALTPAPPPAGPVYNEEPPADDGTDEAGSEERQLLGLCETHTDFPQLAEKDGVAVIAARNSVIAAWLWRRFAANTDLADRAIRIDPWCDVWLEEPVTE